MVPGVEFRGSKRTKMCSIAHVYVGIPPRASGLRLRPRPLRDAKGKGSAREELLGVDRDVRLAEIETAKAKVRLLLETIKHIEAMLE